MAIAYFLVGIGIVLLAMGICMNGWPSLPKEWGTWFGGAGLLSASVMIQKMSHQWAERIRIRRARTLESPLAAALTPQLYGEYSEYVIEAAQQLGAARDTSAVPALLEVLDDCINAQRPGWRDVAEALANALALIGDRRALPLLYRLENVRGIGLIPAIRDAIAAIEPQTSLLRPSQTGGMPAETLLRPAHGYRNEDDPALLLRPTQSETH